MARLKAGDTGWIIESNRWTREVKVLQCTGGIYMIRFADGGGGISVKEHRLYPTEEEAKEALNAAKTSSRSHFTYWG